VTRHESSGDTIPNCLGELGEIRGAGQGQALRLMAIRQARLEPLTLSASWHERMHGEKKDRHCEVHLSRRTSSTASSPWPFEDSHRALATKTRMGGMLEPGGAGPRPERRDACTTRDRPGTAVTT